MASHPSADRLRRLWDDLGSGSHEGWLVRINRGLLGWGLFFISLGAVPLAVRQGLVSEDLVSRAWTLWPLLLVGAGAGILLRGTALEILGGLLVSVTFGLIIGGVLATGAVPFGGCGGNGRPAPFAEQRGDLGLTGSVELQMNCGDLAVTSAPGTGWTLAGASGDGRPPSIQAGSGNLDARSSSRGGLMVLRPGDDWTVTLPADSTIDLTSQVNAGSGRLKLGSARLGAVTIGVNAGSGMVDLGELQAIRRLDVSLNAAGSSRIVLPNLSFAGAIEANASSVQICPPEAAGLRLTASDSVASSNNYAQQGLTQVNGAWETPGFTSAAVKIELTTKANAGRLELLPAGTCHG